MPYTRILVQPISEQDFTPVRKHDQLLTIKSTQLDRHERTRQFLPHPIHPQLKYTPQRPHFRAKRARFELTQV